MALNLKLTLIGLALHLPLSALIENQGQAFCSSIRGEVHYQRADLPKEKISLHEQIALSDNSLLETGFRSHVYFKTSNQLSIGLEENTVLRIADFKLKSSAESLSKDDYKPLSSSFVCELKEGTLSLKIDKLSPLSVVQVKVPNGLFQFSAAECVIEYSHDILKIAVFKGNLSFKFGEDSKTLYLNKSHYYETDAYHIEQGIIEPYLTIEAAPEDWAQLSQFIAYDHKRVIFPAQGDHAHPNALGKIIIPDQFFKKPFVKTLVFSDNN
jgi:hypothetical protein